MTTAIVILSILVLVLFILWRIEKLKAKWYWREWNWFETRYYKLYDAWIKKLTPEELLRVQNHGREKDRMEYDLPEPWTTPV